MTRAGLALLVVSGLLAWTGTAHGSERYDPRLRFRTVSTRHFDVHFHQSEDALARRLAGVAESVASQLEPKLGRPRQRVHVILVDQNDLSNGWATPFPHDVIEITAAAPVGASVIGNTDDWLRLVFTHEYTHILHLDRSKGLIGGLGRVFGRHPALLPNLFVPPWQIEGVATYYESASTGQGRVRAGDFRLLLDRAATTGRFASLDRASSARVDWPWGNTAYLYGSYFHQYLADTYGEATLTGLADETARRIPYLGSGAYKKVFAKSLGQLWREYEARTEARRASASSSSSRATRLTHHGFVVSAPAYARDGRLFYSISNPHGFPALMELRPGGTPREVTTRVAGGRMTAASHEIIFDQVEYVRSVAVQSDIYAVATDSGDVRRLTREARAGDPDLSPDGRTIVCTIQAADRRSLAVLALDRSGAVPTVLVSEPGVSYASPRWSPDGRSIAAERRQLNGPSEIVLIDGATGRLDRTLSADVSARSVNPSWSPDGAGVLFSSDRGAGPFQIYYVDIATQQTRRLTNAGESAQSPVLSADGRTLAFVGYTAEGYDLFSLPWSEAEWTSSPLARASTGATFELPPDGALLSEPRPYSPWSTLLPRYWTPIIEADGDQTAFGAATSGADALGRHGYAVGAAWSTRGRPDWYGAYAYDRWRPTLFANASEDTDSWRGGTVRTREVNAGLSVPFRTFRRTQAVLGALHASSDRFECANCELPIDLTIARRALRSGWLFSTARDYGYSISNEYGVTATLSGEWSARALGSDGDARAAIVDVRGYVPVVPRHGVIALRAAGAASWGDDRARREFGAGGPAASGPGFSFDRDAVALIRGFETDDLTGPRVMTANADYRFPLAWIERGVGSWPFSLRSIHGAVFADGGAAWESRLTRRQMRAAAGGEISVDVVIGYVVPLTVASGFAWRHDPTGASRGAAWFARVGRAF